MKNIYIVLSQTGTIVSRAIHIYTGDPYNHSSISFDADLSIMYSFGRKRRYNIFINGFIEEGLDRGLFPCFPNARCCILEIPVTDEDYAAMKEAVGRFLQNREIYRYNLGGIIGYAVGVRIKRKRHYFCSQFVSSILNSAEFWNLAPEYTKPMDFLKIPGSRLIFEGSIRDFCRRSLAASAGTSAGS